MLSAGFRARDPAWSFAGIANGLMAIPNLVSLLVLSGVIVGKTRLHLWNGDLDRAGEEPAAAGPRS